MYDLKYKCLSYTHVCGQCDDAYCVTCAIIWFITCLFFRHISTKPRGTVLSQSLKQLGGKKMTLQHSGTKRRHSNNVFDLVTPSEYPLSPFSFSFQRWMLWLLGGFLPQHHIATVMYRLMQQKDLESAHSNRHDTVTEYSVHGLVDAPSSECWWDTLKKKCVYTVYTLFVVNCWVSFPGHQILMLWFWI